MTSAIQAELETLTSIIVNTVPVEQIYLFGSYAYGTPHKDSGLDLYVVLKDDAPIRLLDAVTRIPAGNRQEKSNSPNIPKNVRIYNPECMITASPGPGSRFQRIHPGTPGA
ncbi:MAG: nucleotidyltransferase domain-containing protein [Treponema sp.]|jgi:predicted nucleotidyltransferase|nr:nucleotidyltransferase domain-containing protein [Treponema sp.]